VGAKQEVIGGVKMIVGILVVVVKELGAVITVVVADVVVSSVVAGTVAVVVGAVDSVVRRT